MVTGFKRNPNTSEAVSENTKKAIKSVQISGRENCPEHKWDSSCPQRCSLHILGVTKRETKKENWSEVTTKQIMAKNFPVVKMEASHLIVWIVRRDRVRDVENSDLMVLRIRKERHNRVSVKWNTGNCISYFFITMIKYSREATWRRICSDLQLEGTVHCADLVEGKAPSCGCWLTFRAVGKQWD